MIQEIKGDIRDTDCKVIAHGVNCQGVMGSGVARALYEKWPYVKESYLLECSFMLAPEDNSPEDLLGRIDPLGDDGMTILNCFTQQNYGGGDQVYLSYEALQNCMKSVRNYCLGNGFKKIAIPKIGCGLAGGDWNKVKRILEQVFPEDFTVKVYSI